MTLKTNTALNLKGKLSNTLKGYLSYLHAPLTELEEMIEKTKQDNPMIEIQESGFKDRSKNKDLFSNKKVRNSNMEAIEKLTIEKEGLFDKLLSQIQEPLFPTEISVKIGHSIINDLDDGGYFTGDIEKIADDLSCDSGIVERVRKRFANLEPTGIGAIDTKEAYEFQLDALNNLDDKIYETCSLLIKDLDKIYLLKKLPYYNEAIKIIKSFNYPPAIEYMSEDIFIIPDLIVNIDDKKNIKIAINNSYYPAISIDTEGLGKNANHSFIKEQVKNANNIITAIDMRKATLLLVGDEIIAQQYEYFFGGAIKPMRLADIAKELGYNPSTISRAVSNKYIECNRGIIPIKSFFTSSLDKDTEISSTSIKNFIKTIIENENRDKPLSDLKILNQVEKEFNIKIVRRTITKYRRGMNIGSSSDRKKYI